MNNSVLDFALCAKTETFKTLATVERFKVEANLFIFGFTTPSQTPRSMFDVQLMHIRDCTLWFNIGDR